jgi:hypothetical protein
MTSMGMPSLDDEFADAALALALRYWGTEAI